MRNIFLFLTLIFPNTNQLSCFFNCKNIKINISKPFEEPSDIYKCQIDIRATRCYGQIMTYYDEIGKQNYISYSFGSHDHIIEKEMEELANKNDFKFIIYFLFLIESFDTYELIISAYIICQTGDNCALNYTKDLFNLYNQQENPINELSSFLLKSNEISRLSCYDYETKQIIECLTYEQPTCIINNTDIIEQGCYSDLNTKLEYVFMITSSKKNPIKKVFQLIICEHDGCNHQSILKEIELIIYNYTFGMTIPINNSNKQKFYLFYFILFIYIQTCFSFLR